MALSFTQLHSDFAAECSELDLRSVYEEETLEQIRNGMDRYVVLVFRNQNLSGEDQMAFAKRLDGELQTVNNPVQRQSRLGNDSLIDISNLDSDGEIRDPEDRKRLYSLANRLWHTDSSFIDPSGRYSMLYAIDVPSVAADTQYVDTRAAYDRLDPEVQAGLQDLRAHHSIAHSRKTLGFEFTQQEEDELAGVIQPLIRTNPETGRKSLYLASHISRVIGLPVPEGRLLVWELIEQATRPPHIYTHKWNVGDFVIWDNRATMHRGVAYDDRTYRRELRRVTSLDIPPT
ncbi:MAG: TauD/TfdA family dioxygenase [Acidimicrobiaceae bacterium]|nr:TauD/TfdA family dioxygenase [Acidimicrobiaceae bacterium]MBO0746822.1 TauD/TfdA family dioxygenase [Acidimicrobiaceae bacterium]